ncbi:MAG: Gfo/Idh/MocA family oxidoreductase, partial [Tunicatimonas sp.]|uniref:Gfo/Idh/MocA family protein n=1 Tax=Tunicatimonas sp. TaxID=1940096 RepID=UPI003C72E9FF
MSNKTIRWGMIGSGDVAEMKSGPAFQKIANSQLVALMRRNTAKAADFAHRHQVPEWYDDAAKMLNQADINAVYIATPPNSHLDYTLMALEAG